LNKISLPDIKGRCIIGTCDFCEYWDADLSRGYGVYHEETCYRCRIKSAHESEGEVIDI